MPQKLIILILTLLAFSLSFPQGYNMQVVGSWRCPTDDLRDPWVGGIEVLGDYVIMARFDWRREGSDTLWIIDVSDKKNPTLAATYVETTLCPRPAIIRHFTVMPDSNLINVVYYCPSPEDTLFLRVLQLVGDDSVYVVPRGYLGIGYYSVNWMPNQLGPWMFSYKAFYIASPDSPLNLTSHFTAIGDSRYSDSDISMFFARVEALGKDSLSFIGGIAYPAYDPSYPDRSEPAPWVGGGRFILHELADSDTFYIFGFWCGGRYGSGWDGSGVTAIGYSDSMNLVAALTNHYLVLLQPSTNPSDLGRRYFREIGRYRRWKRSAMGYCKLIFDRNYLILCGDDTAYTGITVLRFDSTLSFEVVGYIPGPYRFIAKRGRYVYAYRVCLTGVDIIECLFDSSGVNDGGSYYRHDVEGIDIYPNPVYYGGKVNILSRHGITIYDIRGNVAAKISGGNKTVKLNLAPGVYFAVSNDKGKKAITKFVVIK